MSCGCIPDEKILCEEAKALVAAAKSEWKLAMSNLEDPDFVEYDYRMGLVYLHRLNAQWSTNSLMNFRFHLRNDNGLLILPDPVPGFTVGCEREPLRPSDLVKYVLKNYPGVDTVHIDAPPSIVDQFIKQNIQVKEF
jgi:hypothetical protein